MAERGIGGSVVMGAWLAGVECKRGDGCEVKLMEEMSKADLALFEMWIRWCANVCSMIGRSCSVENTPLQ